MSETPNMLLELPEVSETIGPTWASMLNAALEAIDEHTHATDSGVKITPAGMNINATLEINSQDITEVNSLSLDTRASAPSTLRALYSKSGDLYFKNTSGTEVQVTNGGTIAGTPGSITNLGDGGSSAVFSDINEDFTWYFTGTRLAAMNVGDVRLYPFDGAAAYTNAVTLKSPTSLASSYSITMPGTAPAQSGVWSVNTSGVIQNGLHAGTAANPSVYWNGDVNTGVYSDTADTFQISTGGTLRHTINTTAETLTLPIRGADGSASAPMYSFSGDTDLGFYRVGANQLGLGPTGTTTQFLVPNGAVATPAISFTGDPNTGLYWTSADVINMSCGGALSAQFAAGGSYFPSGTASDPGISFLSDPDTGFYRAGSGEVGFAADGVLSAYFAAEGLYSPFGTVSLPGMSFFSDPDTGFYRSATGEISFSADGVQSSILASSGLYTVAGSAGTPSYSFNSDPDTGMYNSTNEVRFATGGTHRGSFKAGGISTPTGQGIDAGSSGDFIMWKVFTGTLAASATTTLAAPSGIVLGAVGVTGASGVAITSGLSMMQYGDVSSDRIDFDDNVISSEGVRIVNNDAANTNAYRVLVYYV